jgi:hypothetical protein
VSKNGVHLKATIGFPQLYDYFTNPNAPVKASDAGWVEVGKNNLSTLEAHVNSDYATSFL